MKTDDGLDDLLHEAAEHISAAQRVLLASEQQTPLRGDVDLLFRAFHSLKGLARVASRPSLEGVLHDAETWLAQVRSGEAEITSASIERLLQITDVTPEALRGHPVAGLEPGGAIARAVKELAASSGDKSTARTSASARRVDPLGLEEEMSEAFAELLQEIIPSIARQIGEDRHADASLLDDLEVLRHAAERLGLPGLAIRTADLLKANERTWRARFVEILRILNGFELLTGRNCGCQDAHPLTGEAVQFGVASVAEPAEFGELSALLTQLGVDEAMTGDVIESEPARRLSTDDGHILSEVLIELPDAARMSELVEHLSVLSSRTIVGDQTRLALLLVSSNAADALAETQKRVGAAELKTLDRSSPPEHFAKPTTPVAASGIEETQVRVPVEVLDRLFGRIGSFFSLGARLNVLGNETGAADALRRLYDVAVTRMPEILPEVELLSRDRRDFLNIEAEVSRLISLIHESTLGLRVIPFDNVVARFPRVVREMSRELGKSVQFDLASRSIKIDKGMADMLVDPITHMIRNAIDHGIETPDERRNAGKHPTAKLSVHAEQIGNRLVLSIADDGRGIDIGRVARKAMSQGLVTEADLARMNEAHIARLIFTPGFSTRDQASDLSGRGVGLDVALVNVTKLGGTIHIDNRPGEGLAFKLDMPLSAAIRPILLVDTGIQVIGFPESLVSEALVAPADSLQSVNGQPSLLLRERFLPVFDLCDLLGLPKTAKPCASEMSIVVCQWNGQRAAFRVSRIQRRIEVLIRETHPRVAGLPGVGGVSTLGADRIVLVLDPDKLFTLASKAMVKGLHSAVPAPAPDGVVV